MSLGALVRASRTSDGLKVRAEMYEHFDQTSVASFLAGDPPRSRFLGLPGFGITKYGELHTLASAAAAESALPETGEAGVSSDHIETGAADVDPPHAFPSRAAENSRMPVPTLEVAQASLPVPVEPAAQPAAGSPEFADLPPAVQARLRAISLGLLIRCSGVSTRLGNMPFRTSLFDETPVAAFLTGAVSNHELLKAPEFGRTSLRELRTLAESYLADLLQGVDRLAEEADLVAAEPEPDTEPESREAHPLDGLTVADLSALTGFPIRIANRLGMEPRLRDLFLTDIVRDPDGMRDALLTLPGLGRKSIADLIHLVQTVVPADLKNSTEQPAEETSPEPASGPLPTPREAVAVALDALHEKHRFVLDARYGLDGTPPQTLDEVGRRVFVTRERVRQVEKKALQALRKRPWRTAFERLLRDERSAIWVTIAGGDGFVPADEIGPRSRRVEPLLQLAVDVRDDGFRAWMDEVAEPVPGGWLAPGGSADDLEQDAASLRAALSRMALPRPFADVWQAAGLDASRAETVLAMVADYRVRGSYIHQGHLGAKARRLARLHELALAGASGNIIDAWHLAALDATAGHDDELSPRMVQLQLAEASHLFARLFDQYWVVLPTDSTWAGGPQAVPAPAHEDLAPRFDAGSLSSWVYETLRRDGPMRHVDLRDQAVIQVPGVSASSVGPMLLMHPVFHRIAPGVFDIRRATPATPSVPGSLLSTGQCRTYARARKSGASQDYFSGWTGEFEWRLCEWARTESDGEIFRSLLSVSDPASWPAPETVRTEWRRLKQLHGRWSLGTERLQALGSEPPSPAEFFAGVVHVAALGSIGWIGAGRVTQARLGSQGGGDLLALLVATGCAESPADWQSAHDATSRAGTVADALAVRLHETGLLDWNAPPLAALLDEAASNASRVRWANPAEVQALAGALRGAQPRHPVAAAGPVLEEVEDLFASEEWEQLFTG